MMLTKGYEKFRLIEVWVIPGSKNKPELRTSRVSYFKDREDAFTALQKAGGDMNRLLENISDDRQIWHQ